MKYRYDGVKLLAVLVFLTLWTPLASASTNVSIMYNGEAQADVELDASDIVYKSINIGHNQSDFAWNKVKVLINVISRSTVRDIKKIYLYKCVDKQTASPRLLGPVDCVRTVDPLKFDTYIDTELSWLDISVPTTSSFYPQESNLLMFVKLEGLGQEGSPVWLAFFDNIVRTDFDKFNIYSHDLDRLEFHAKSSGLAGPVRSYIENYQTIPFSWAEKVVFSGAGSLTALGADKDELESEPISFSIVQPAGTEITEIGKEYFFIIPETTSGTANAITLNLNPTFTCGDGDCESALGESSESCCYDCGCQDGYYCSVGGSAAAGTCMDESEIALEAEPVGSVQVADCTQAEDIQMTVRVRNPPSGLEDVAYGILNLGGSASNINCEGSGGVYTCPVTVEPSILCGSGSETYGPGSLVLDIAYMDGQNSKTKSLTADIPEFVVEYSCGCGEGMYCDSVSRTCESEDRAGLEIVSSESLLSDFTGSGDTAEVTAEITDPPGGLAVDSFSFTVGGIDYDDGQMSGYSGELECSGSGDAYTCRIPVNIDNYNNQKQYVLRNIVLKASVSFPDGSSTKSRTLEADVAEITIPAVICGDGVLAAGETSETCCIDAGCNGTGQYCDIAGSCKSLDGIVLNVTSVKPQNATDCLEEHTIKIKAVIENMPTDTVMDNYLHLVDEAESEYSIECDEPKKTTGIVNCRLIVPPVEDCAAPYFLIGPNRLQLDVSFPDGNDMASKELAADFADIHIVPAYHPGDGICESGFGESAAVACVDCPCEADADFGEGWYCSFDMDSNPNGTCLALQNITLVVESPTSDVNLGSCDMPDELEVKLHIDNAPEGMYLENYVANIGGKTTDYISCEEDIYSQYGGGANKYTCTITVTPDEKECTSQKEISYTGNSISLFISFNNGLNTELWTLTGSLPDIKLQGIQPEGPGDGGVGPGGIVPEPVPPGPGRGTLKANIDKLLKNLEDKKKELNETVKKLKSNAWHCRNNLNLFNLFWEVGEFALAWMSGNPGSYLKHVATSFGLDLSGASELYRIINKFVGGLMDKFAAPKEEKPSGVTGEFTPPENPENSPPTEEAEKIIEKAQTASESKGILDEAETDFLLSFTDSVAKLLRSSWKAACKRAEINAEVAEKYYQQQLSIMLKAESCIANWQMQIDAGSCEGQEYYCFQQMVGCWEEAVQQLGYLQEDIDRMSEQAYQQWLKEDKIRQKEGGGFEIKVDAGVLDGVKGERLCGVELLEKGYRNMKFNDLKEKHPDKISGLKPYDYKWYQYDKDGGKWLKEDDKLKMVDYGYLPISYTAKDSYTLKIIRVVCPAGKPMASLGGKEMEIFEGENKIGISWFVEFSAPENSLLNLFCSGFDELAKKYRICFCPGDLRFGCDETICEPYWKGCAVAGKPDLAVVYSKDDLQLSGEGKDQLTFYIKNIGKGPVTDEFGTVVYRIRGDGGTEEIDRKTTSEKLEPERSVKMMMNYDFGQNDKVLVVADPANKVEEADENNNCLLIDISTGDSEIPTNCEEFIRNLIGAKTPSEEQCKGACTEYNKNCQKDADYEELLHGCNSVIKEPCRCEAVTEEQNKRPLADFSFSPESPGAGGEVTFTDESRDDDGEIASWKWDFGDGSASEVQSPVHTYSEAGGYSVTLIVTDDRGGMGSAIKELSVKEAVEVKNQPPVADFTCEIDNLQIGSKVPCEDKSSDDKGIKERYWSLTIGGLDYTKKIKDISGDDSSKKIEFTIEEHNYYTVKLEVVDEDGLKGEKELKFYSKTGEVLKPYEKEAEPVKEGVDIFIPRDSIKVLLTGDGQGVDFIKFDIKNMGKKDIETGFQVKVWGIRKNGEVTNNWFLKRVSTLKSGQSVSRDKNFKYPAIGGKPKINKLVIEPDWDNKVEEADEGNNIIFIEVDNGMLTVSRCSRVEGKTGIGGNYYVNCVDAEKIIEKGEKLATGGIYKPTVKITRINGFDVKKNKQEVGTVSGTVKIEGEAEDMDGNEGLKVMVTASYLTSLGQPVYTMYYKDVDNYNPSTGKWSITWDTTKDRKGRAINNNRQNIVIADVMDPGENRGHDFRVYADVKNEAVEVPENKAPEIRITGVDGFDVSGQGEQNFGPISGKVKIYGTARDPEGDELNIKVDSFYVAGGIGHWMLQNARPDYNPSNGEWEIEWDTTVDNKGRPTQNIRGNNVILADAVDSEGNRNRFRIEVKVGNEIKAEKPQAQLSPPEVVVVMFNGVAAGKSGETFGPLYGKVRMEGWADDPDGDNTKLKVYVNSYYYSSRWGSKEWILKEKGADYNPSTGKWSITWDTSKDVNGEPVEDNKMQYVNVFAYNTEDGRRSDRFDLFIKMKLLGGAGQSITPDFYASGLRLQKVIKGHVKKAVLSFTVKNVGDSTGKDVPYIIWVKQVTDLPIITGSIKGGMKSGEVRHIVAYEYPGIQLETYPYTAHLLVNPDRKIEEEVNLDNNEMEIEVDFSKQDEIPYQTEQCIGMCRAAQLCDKDVYLTFELWVSSACAACAGSEECGECGDMIVPLPGDAYAVPSGICKNP
jgi:PKD repeat protein